MSDDESIRATVAALLANIGIMVSKFVAFGFTGSSAMLAEGAHSFADSGNQLLLLFGRVRARREPDALHPFGFGRERYLYAFIVAVVLFSVGGLFSLYEGYRKISDPHPLESWPWAIGVLLAAAVMESLSLRTAVAASNRIRGRRSWSQFVRHARIPELPVVLLEDFAALVGLGFALVGVGLAVVTRNPVFDGIGSIAIGVLLVIVAAILATETKSMIIGEAASREQVRAIEQAVRTAPDVAELTELRTVYLGPDRLLVVGRVRLEGGLDSLRATRALEAAERAVAETVSIAAEVYLAPASRPAEG